MAFLWLFFLMQRFLTNPFMYTFTDVTGIDSLNEESWHYIPLGEDDRLLSNLSLSRSL